MAKFIYITIEINSENSDGDAITLYFKGEPTAEEVKRACKEEKVDGPIGPMDPSFYWHSPTPVSDMAGLVRIQTPAG
jgi:hypothetical protein